jgi:hypothetical protein
LYNDFTNAARGMQIRMKTRTPKTCKPTCVGEAAESEIRLKYCNALEQLSPICNVYNPFVPAESQRSHALWPDDALWEHRRQRGEKEVVLAQSSFRQAKTRDQDNMLTS